MKILYGWKICQSDSLAVCHYIHVTAKLKFLTYITIIMYSDSTNISNSDFGPNHQTQFQPIFLAGTVVFFLLLKFDG